MLLSLLDDDRIRTTAQLAEALGTSVEMVEAKLERYEQLGYVKKSAVSAECAKWGKCRGCPGCGAPGGAPPVVFWERLPERKDGAAPTRSCTQSSPET